MYRKATLSSILRAGGNSLLISPFLEAADNILLIFSVPKTKYFTRFSIFFKLDAGDNIFY